MKKHKPKPRYLYHWNAQDGYVGSPKRKIHIKPFDPCLLRVAYLAGVSDWKTPDTLQNSVLGLVLYASPLPNPTRIITRFLIDTIRKRSVDG